METQCRDDSGTMTEYASKCCSDQISVCYDSASQLCSDSTKFTPYAFVYSSCDSHQSADGATETFKSTFSCPSGCYSECPEGCNSYNEGYYRCSCDNDAISTEAECERKNTWFLIYMSILLAIRVRVQCSSVRCCSFPSYARPMIKKLSLREYR